MSQEIIMPGERHQPVALHQQGQEISMLSTISRLALDPRCDMDKLERLISLQDRMEAKTALEAFNAAFAEMQCEMPSVEKRTENTHTKKMYADLDDINYAVRPVMAKFGFGVSFKIVNQAAGVSITGILMHKGGHREETTMILPLDTGAGRTAVQSVGSTTTYGKRYVMCPCSTSPAATTTTMTVMSNHPISWLRQPKQDRFKPCWISAARLCTPTLKRCTATLGRSRSPRLTVW